LQIHCFKTENDDKLVRKQRKIKRKNEGNQKDQSCSNTDFYWMTQKRIFLDVRKSDILSDSAAVTSKLCIFSAYSKMVFRNLNNMCRIR
jgi:hypothetical protein